ncbi:MAG: right-handed parallel beta-helix repeat-containing protein [Pseudomonadota bacterium]
MHKFLVIVFSLVCPFVAVYGNTYHVRQTIDIDTHPEDYFSSIQDCADIARPGDICIIHAGKYEESIVPPVSGEYGRPIVFKAASGEHVLVTGASKPDTEWVQQEDGVSWAMFNPNVRDVFIGDTPLTHARFPNSEHHFDPILAPINLAECAANTGWTSAIEDCVSYDQDGPCSSENNCWNSTFPKFRWRLKLEGLDLSKDWKGGLISIVDGGGFNSERAVINSSSLDGLIVEWMAEKPLREGFKASISGVVAALDRPGEWATSADRSQVYVYPPFGNTIYDVRIRNRLYGFNLANRRHIVLDGLHFFAASVHTDELSADLLMTGLTVRFPTFPGFFGNSPSYPGQASNRHQISSESYGLGLTLAGANNELRNSKISDSWCDGVTLMGEGHRVANNEIYNVNWSMTQCAAIAMNGRHHVIHRNTLRDCGRACLWHQKTYDSEFSFNNVFNGCWLGLDCGLVGSYNWFGPHHDLSSDLDEDGIGNVYHHNWIHDNKSKDGGVCVYLDNNEQGYTLSHNVVWNCRYAFVLNSTFKDHLPTRHDVLNNTCFDVEVRMSTFGRDGQWGLSEVEFSHNLCTSSIDSQFNPSSMPDIKLIGNVGPQGANVFGNEGKGASWPAERLGLQDVRGRDFRPLRDLSSNGNRGSEHEGPSAGAYQTDSLTPWKAGHGIGDG